jgi:AraC-like DNA-binding protein
VVKLLFAEAATRGLDAATLGARFGISDAELDDPNARVGADTMRRIWTELPVLTGAENFGLDAAQRVATDGGSMAVAQLVASARTLGEGLLAGLRYRQVIQDTLQVTWVEVDGEFRIELHDSDPAILAPRHSIEFSIARAILLARQVTGRSGGPRAIAFRHERPADDSVARRVFDCELMYGAPLNVVAVPRELLALRHRTANRNLAAFFTSRVREFDVPNTFNTVVAKVRRILAEQLADGAVSLESIAKRLRLGPRTAQRRLREEGMTLVQVVDELRRDLAIRHLEESDMEIQDIAFALGFSDKSAFHHAFVRWSGKTPGEYRTHHRRRF